MAENTEFEVKMDEIEEQAVRLGTAEDEEFEEAAGDLPPLDLPAFTLPELVDNVSGWGPTDECNAQQLEKLPFAPFKKSDPLAKASDWNPKLYARGNRYQQETFGTGSSSLVWNPVEESTFSTVDGAAAKASTGGKSRKKKKKPWVNRSRQNQTQKAKRGQAPRRKRHRRPYNQRRWYQQENEQTRDPSVKIEDDWKEIATFTLEDLQKCSFDSKALPAPETLRSCGALPRYRKEMFDLISARKPPRLSRYDGIHYITTTTSDDPVIQALDAEQQGNVFLTDSIMALLMACPRSIYGWDIVITKREDQLYFDQRINSRIDFVTVNETDHEPRDQEPDSINHPTNLAQEATFINHNFSHQVVSKTSKDQLEFDEQNPFLGSLEEGQKAATVGYRYRKWQLEAGMEVVARCELNGYIKSPRGNSLLSIKALNEFDNKISAGQDWRQKIETQWGSILLTEIRNNRYKLARWAAQALIAGADEVKLGCVSRNHSKDPDHHVILAVQKLSPSSFAQELSLNLSNMWGILRFLIRECMKQPDGKYLLFKDPNEPKLQLYSIPENAFDDEILEQEGETQ